MENRHRLEAALFLFIVWGGMVLLGKASPSDFVTALRDALVALGVFHAALADPKSEKQSPNSVSG